MWGDASKAARGARDTGCGGRRAAKPTALRTIPAGETRSYARLAAALGVANAVRAVGRANALNPVCIVVPCHRLIGSDGSLRGYSGGLERKRWLLRHEGVDLC